ncbi:MAG: hypothetical protein JHC87_04015 [Thermoleophilaceae bacterium]|nr:hypothetical protein [Thermoleophilaceae bacterium]
MNKHTPHTTLRSKIVHYDRENQRVWVAGWRLHHGFTGMVLAALGGALMAHDWKDLPHWIHDHSES